MIDESQVRAKLFEWLEKESARNGGIFTRKQLLNDFSVAGERIALVGPRGIWIPKQFESIPISITTASRGPYEDSIDENLLFKYKYFGNDPNHRDNVGLTQAWRTQTPLVYFLSPSPDNYQALWPVYIIENHPETLSVTAEIKAAYSPSILGDNMPEGVGEMDGRQYRSAVMRQRIHQQAFRIRVLYAYNDNCAVCYIKHTELLDAAHIIPDGKPHGEPVVPNGLSLCKIHHAAFDSNIIGINPDHIIEVRSDILREHDGPMLKHGLQELHGQRIRLPKHKSDWPDRERLEWRIEEFRKAG